ncbi:MAG: DNA polymerase III subunit gamma/tau [Zetaproteobacteria bacterium]|nr:MAG: DNA polymerase III subunit gamma/tau [Zetaproteobacteria bacterium]
MSYLVLARRWRPRKFADLVGQDIVVRTLRNAVAQGRLAHAYLFCGIRGVGKTTLARLMAMSINCEAVEEGEPCGQCASCQGILNGSLLEVQEMDAASHTGVDDIREIIDGIRYPPASTRYKVYIIDEAHMLSRNAFNALLKTLEEPPSWALFILATTEPEKLPLTVRSRCQRFDLRRLSTMEILAYLKQVAEREGITHDEEALLAIARAAGGSVRDALSLGERLLVYGNGAWRQADVRQALGLVEDDLSCRLSEAIFEGKGADAVRMLREAQMAGHGVRSLLQSLASLWHRLGCSIVDRGLVHEELNEPMRQWLSLQAERLSWPWLDLRYQVLVQGMRDFDVLDETLGGEMLLLRLAGLNLLDEQQPRPAVQVSSSPTSSPVSAPASVAGNETEQDAKPVTDNGLPLGGAVSPGYSSWAQAVEAYAGVRPGIAAILECVVCTEFGERVRLQLTPLQERQLSVPDRGEFETWLGREVFWERRQEGSGESLSEQRRRRMQAEEERLRRIAEQDPHVRQLRERLDAELVKVLPAGVQDDERGNGEA